MSAAPDARVALRKRGVLESADLALRFTMAHVRALAWLSAVVLAPGFAATVALRYAAGLDWAVVWPIAVVLAMLAEGPFTVALGRLALGTEVTVREVAALFVRRAPMFVAAVLGALIIDGVSGLLLAAPALLALLGTVFIPEVTLLEGAGFSAFRRSFRISTGFTGRAFGVVLILIVGRAFAIVVADFALRGTVGVVLDLRVRSESLFTDGGSSYALAGLWLSVPLCAAVRYFQYIDLRTLREGWDVQRRFQGLAARLREEGAQ